MTSHTDHLAWRPGSRYYELPDEDENPERCGPWILGPTGRVGHRRTVDGLKRWPGPSVGI